MLLSEISIIPAVDTMQKLSSLFRFDSVYSAWLPHKFVKASELESEGIIAQKIAKFIDGTKYLQIPDSQQGSAGVNQKSIFDGGKDPK